MQTAISCVIGNDPRFLPQARLLLASLRSAGIGQDDESTVFVVHVPQEMAAAPALEPLRQLGALIQPYQPFPEGSGDYCSKLVQLETEALHAADRVLLVDAGLLFLHDPRPLFDAQAVRAKIVDFPLPPAEKWQRLFSEAGFAEVATAAPDFVPEELTPARNCNSGAYYLPKSAFAALAEAWPRWSRHCLAQTAILGNHLRQADQLGFAMAMQELDLPFRPLELGDNFPTHFEPPGYSHLPPRQINAIHYHGNVDALAVPMPVGVDWIDRQIGQAIDRIRQNYRIELDNAAFWENHYASKPEPGAGLTDKRRQIAPVLSAWSDGPVVDIGCGDLALMAPFDLEDYTGYDLAPSGLDLARASRPDWQFRQGSSSAVPKGAAALSVCLDVAIHQSSPESYRQLVHDAIEASRDAVLISGYDAPVETRGIVFFHEPLSQTLAAHPAIAHVTRIGGWGDVTLLLAERRHEGGNPNDITAAGLCAALATSSHPGLLKSLVRLGRDKLGFFPRTVSRSIAYPWIAARLPQRPEGLRVLVLGAGVSPLPLWLARQGAEVTTVDSHDQTRLPPAQPDWTEQGYLDYGLIDHRTRAHHGSLQDLEDAGPFDMICSTGAIADLPAETRRSVLAAIRDRLGPGGRLLLTLDLIAGTDRLGAAEGADHGTIADLLAELAALGLAVSERTERRAIADSPTELLLLEARL